MKNFLKKSVLLASFWLFLSSFLFSSEYRYNSVYNTTFYNSELISQKDNSELTCTNYLINNDLYIKIKFKEYTPSEEQLKKLLEGAKGSINAADDKLDSMHGRNMNINYIFVDKNGSTILTATYID